MTAMKPLKSSALAAHGYDAISRVLKLQFTGSDRMHEYHDVPPEVAAGLETAESAGRYYAAEIRGKFGKPEEPEAADA